MCKNLFGKGGSIMNEVIKDIQKLEDVRWKIRNVNPLNEKAQDLLLNTISLLDKMITEKEIVVKTFERHHAYDRSQWMNDITTILKLGEK